jgi:diguanylate cyclase (GGDEF)-like protein
MNFNLLKHHSALILLLFIMIVATVSNSLIIGTPKASVEIEWTDALGEGGIALITLVWIFFTLISRPPGTVTSLLVVGLLFMHVSLLLDVMDEFLRYPEQHAWLTAYESIPAPIGMIFLSIGLFHWHKEQLMVNEQLRKREQIHRQHSLIDPITGLYNADYMTLQLLQRAKLDEPTVVVMIDIDDFDSVVRSYGDERCDQLLAEVSELLLLAIGPSDLACRYAGDRFILLLTHTSLQGREKISENIVTDIERRRFQPLSDYPGIQLKLTAVQLQLEVGSDVDKVYARLNESMESAKFAKRSSVAA